MFYLYVKILQYSAHFTLSNCFQVANNFKIQKLLSFLMKCAKKVLKAKLRNKISNSFYISAFFLNRNFKSLKFSNSLNATLRIRIKIKNSALTKPTNQRTKIERENSKSDLWQNTFLVLARAKS